MAAAAAIAAEGGFHFEVDPSEDSITSAAPSGDEAAPDSLSERCTEETGVADGGAERSVAPEAAAAEPEPEGELEPERQQYSLAVAGELPADPEFAHLFDLVEVAPVNPASDSCSVAEIEIIDQEADRFPAVDESATVHLLPEPSIFAEVASPDSQSLRAAACENDTGLDADVAQVPPVPSNEQLQSWVSETLAADQAVGMFSDGEQLPANLFAEADESSAGHAVDVCEDEPSPPKGGYLAVMSEETRGAALQGVDKCSVDMICVKLEAALSEQIQLGARERPIDLRADYYGNGVSENSEGIERRIGSRRKATVQARKLNIPRRRFIPRWPLSNLHSGILALALLDVFLVGWRTDIVRKLPQTASFYALAGLPVNLRGLAFDNITTSSVRDDGTSVLVVEGNVINDTRKNLRVPEIRFVVRDAAAQEIYSWTARAARTSLPPGQAATFRTRLASPPPGAHDLVLRFVSRRDAIAVIR